MSSEYPQRQTVAALRQALPYLKLFQGKTFVVKFGGEVFEEADNLRQLFEQIGVLHRVGIRVVVVHGGGPQTTSMAEKLGQQQTMVGGRRVTDGATLETSSMVLNGALNTRAVALFRELGIGAVGLSGVDADIVTATRRPPVEVDGATVDYGFVGDIDSIQPGLIHRLMESSMLPVISPLSADAEGNILNVNADVVAARVAEALGADKLIVMSSVPGLLEDVQDPGSLVSYTDVAGLNDYIERGVVKDGMLPKVASVLQALKGGVPRVHLISFRVQDSLLAEVFTNEGSGTMVVSSVDDVELVVGESS
ncbi:MAG: acetylglutamate kinase [Myxococcota bacterium]|nr:acetylglutamate kinase [Myxococcota bacterium]